MTEINKLKKQVGYPTVDGVVYKWQDKRGSPNEFLWVEKKEKLQTKPRA